MYVAFVAAYLLVRSLTLRRKLSDERRMALVSVAVTDQALGELDGVHRDKILVRDGAWCGICCSTNSPHSKSTNSRA